MKKKDTGVVEYIAYTIHNDTIGESLMTLSEAKEAVKEIIGDGAYAEDELFIAKIVPILKSKKIEIEWEDIT